MSIILIFNSPIKYFFLEKKVKAYHMQLAREKIHEKKITPTIQ